MNPVLAPAAHVRATTHPPLSGTARLAGTLALSLTIFMSVLDATIANVSIPAISGDLGASVHHGTWVITSFAVANAITVPLTGWLSQRMGQVRVFLGATLLFVLASWLCGLATSLDGLIACRVLQGAVAGPIIPLSQSLILASFPRASARTAIAIWSMTTLLALVAGPLLGGWISDHYSWRWIFYINVPIGLLACWTCWRIYRHRESATTRAPSDVVGILLLVIWVGCLQVLLDKGATLGWFDSPVIIGLAVVALVAFVYFLIWELTERHPVVDLRLFAERNFLVGTVTMAMAFALFFGNIIILPLWLQTHMGYTATDAGMVMAPVGLCAFLFTPLVGRLLGRVDARAIITLAFLAFATVCVLRAGFTPQVDRYHLLVPTVFQGLAMAAFFVPLTVISLSRIDVEQVAAASSLSNFCRLTAGSFGVSAATTVWDGQATSHRTQFTAHLQQGSPAYEQATQALVHAGLAPDQAVLSINRLVDVQAFTLSTLDIFQWSAVLFIGLTAIVWCARRPAAAAVRHAMQ